jgi:glycerol-3-phosphate dehydrogenase (NAD(P)+)
VAGLGNDVRLWAHGEQRRERLRTERVNEVYLPGINLPKNINVVETVTEAAEADVVVIATPTQFIRTALEPLTRDLLLGKVVVSASKGIERGTLKRISEIAEELWDVESDRFVCLSGPSHAEEVSRELPTAVVAASTRMESAELVQDLFTSHAFRVYSSPDLLGVELGGALKNVIALCAGITDGLGFGDNTKAGLITRGLAEITRLGVALGANAQTFSGLSGLGDLVVTCTSRHSRNRHVGEQIGLGRTLDEVIGEMDMVAEGITTTQSAYQLARRHDVEIPITNQVHAVLFENKDPLAATSDLMSRETKQEIWN